MDQKVQEITALVIHGAWHVPAHYVRLEKHLQDKGYQVTIPRLPSTNGMVPPDKTMKDDVAVIEAQATELVESGRTVVVICHSYGGMVTTNALTAELSASERKQAGKAGGIVQLIYICAFIPQLDKSVVDYIADAGAALKFEFNDKGNVSPENPIEGFYNDMQDADAKAAAEQIVTCPFEILTSKTTRVAWLHFPVAYVHCEFDQAVPIELQRRMVKAVTDGESPMEVLSLPSSHSPFLSMPNALMDAIAPILTNLTKA